MPAINPSSGMPQNISNNSSTVARSHPSNGLNVTGFVYVPLLLGYGHKGNNSSSWNSRQVRSIEPNKEHQQSHRHQAQQRKRAAWQQHDLACRHMRKFTVRPTQGQLSTSSSAAVKSQMGQKLFQVKAQMDQAQELIEEHGLNQTKAFSTRRKSRKLLKAVTGWNAGLVDYQRLLTDGNDYKPCSRKARKHSPIVNQLEHERRLASQGEKVLRELESYINPQNKRHPRTTNTNLQSRNTVQLMSQNLISGERLKETVRSTSGVHIGDQKRTKVQKNQCKQLQANSILEPATSATIRLHIQQQGIPQSLPAAYQALNTLTGNMNHFIENQSVNGHFIKDCADLREFQKMKQTLIFHMNNREKYLAQGDYFKPCTSSKRQPKFHTDSTQGKMIINLIFGLAKIQSNLAEKYPNDFPQHSDYTTFVNHFLSNTPSMLTKAQESERIYELVNQLTRIENFSEDRLSCPPTTIEPETTALPDTDQTTVYEGLDVGRNETLPPPLTPGLSESCQQTINDTPVLQQCYQTSMNTFPITACNVAMPNNTSSLNQLWESPLNGTWISNFEQTLLDQPEIINSQNGTGCEYLKLVENIKAFISMELLMQSAFAFADVLNGTSTNASANFRQLADDLANDMAALSHTPSRVKRSDPPEVDAQESVITERNLVINKFFDNLVHNENGANFIAFSNGYRDRVNDYLNKVNTHGAKLSEADQLIQQLTKTKFRESEINSLKAQIYDSIREGNYYQAGERTYNLGIIVTHQMAMERGQNPLRFHEEGVKQTPIGSTSSLTLFTQAARLKITPINTQMNYALIFSDPIFVKGIMGGERFGTCMGYVLFQSTSLDSGVNTFERISDDLTAYHSPSNIGIYKTIAILQAWYSNLFRQQHAPNQLASTYKKLQHSGVKTGSAFFKNTNIIMTKIIDQVLSLSNTGQMWGIDHFSQNLFAGFDQQHSDPLAQEVTTNHVEYCILLPTHIIRLSISKNKVGTYKLVYENIASKIIHAVNLEMKIGRITEPEKAFNELIKNDVKKHLSSTENMIHVVPIPLSLSNLLGSIRVNPATLLTIKEQASLSLTKQETLENTLVLSKFSEFFSLLSKKKIFMELKQPVPTNFAVNENKVSSSDPIITQWSELDYAIQLNLKDGTPFDTQTITLASSIFKSWSSVLKLLNNIPPAQLKAALSEEKFTELKTLTDSFFRFFYSPSVATLPKTQRQALFSGSLETLGVEAGQFSQTIEAMEQLTEGATAPSEWSKPTLSAKQEADFLQAFEQQVYKNAASKMPLARTSPWLSDLAKERQAMATTLMSQAKLLSATIGSLGQGYDTTEETTLLEKMVQDSLESALQQVPGGSAFSEVPGSLKALMKVPMIRAFIAHQFRLGEDTIAQCLDNLVLKSPQTTGLTQANLHAPTKTNVGPIVGGVVGGTAAVAVAGVVGKAIYKSAQQPATLAEQLEALEEIGIRVQPEPISDAESHQVLEDNGIDAPDAPSHDPETTNNEASNQKSGRRVPEEGQARHACKRSLDSACSPRDEVSETSEIEVRNGADTLEVEGQGLEGLEIEGAVLEELPGMETIITSVGFNTARSELKLLKNLRWTGTSRVLPATSPIAKLLPSNSVNWVHPGFRSAGLSRALQLFPKAAVRLLGVLSDAVAPLIYGAIISLQLSDDIGKWMEQKVYEQGLTTVDDIMTYLSFIFPVAMFWPKTAPALALQRLHEINNRFVPWLSVPASPLLGLQAFESLHEIASDPGLGLGHARFDFPDGTVLYRTSYKKSDMPISTRSAQKAFDLILQGETTQGRVDFYVITKKTEDQSQVVLASGTYFGITSSVLDQLNAKHKHMEEAFRAINTIYSKYIFETLNFETLEREIMSEPYLFKGLSDHQKLHKRIQARNKLVKEFPVMKKKKEAESQAKVESIYSAIEQPMSSFVFEAKREEAATHEFFKTTALYAANNDTLNWQEVRNQRCSFMLKKGEEGYQDDITIGNEYLDPEYRKRIKPAYTGLERENFPVEGTAKAQAQQQNLQVYVTNTGKALVDLLHFYPDVEFKGSESSLAVNLYGATDTTGRSASSRHGFDASIVSVPNILGACRHARYDAGSKFMESYHSTYDDVVPTLPFEQIQVNRASENLQNLDQQTFTFLETRGRGTHLLFQRQIPIGALLRAELGTPQRGEGLPSRWSHYSSDAKQQVYALALQQLSGANHYLPIFDTQQGIPLIPEQFPIISNTGHNHTLGLFYRDTNDGLQQFKASSNSESNMNINVNIPWKPTNGDVNLFKVRPSGRMQTTSVAKDSYNCSTKVKRKVVLNRALIFGRLARWQSKFRDNSHRLWFRPFDQSESLLIVENISIRQLRGHGAIKITSSIPLDFQKGEFSLQVRLKSTSIAAGEMHTLELSRSEVKYSENHYLHITGSLPADDYVWQSSTDNDKKSYMVVSPDTWSHPLENEGCEVSPVLSSLSDTKQSINAAIMEAGGRYQNKWQEIFERVINLEQDHSTQTTVDNQIIQYRFEPDSTTGSVVHINAHSIQQQPSIIQGYNEPDSTIEPVATNAHSITQQPQAINNQSQSSGNHQLGTYTPCKKLDFVEGTRRYLDNIVHLMRQCDQMDGHLTVPQLTLLLSSTIGLPQEVMTNVITSYVNG